MQLKSLVHTNPVWRERADFIIGAKCSREEGSASSEWEQLWSRRIANNRFEICCIPFFVYNVSLGDEVETGTEWGMPYMVQRVVRPSGRYTFRAWFKESRSPTARYEVPEEVNRLGGLTEWSSENLLAIDAPSDDHAWAMKNLLSHRQELGHLVYESGWT